jgi:tRNA uridine 5-carbamoylmethylation protein Kti12
MKKVIFTMGLPGAGKSTALRRMEGLEKYIIIDPDKIKEEKKDYDPKKPQIYHEWSKLEANKRELKAIEEEKNIIIDGTGTNTLKMYKKINEYKKIGYNVKLIYVKVLLETSIKRNSQRARVVPIEVIFEKYELIEESYEILKNVANESIIINND